MIALGGQPRRRRLRAVWDPIGFADATDDCSMPAAGTSSAAERGEFSSPRSRAARRRHQPMRGFTPCACLQCDWSVVYDCRSALNRHMRTEHGVFYSAKRDCYVALRGGEPRVRQQSGHSALRHSPRTTSTGSNAERRKLLKLASEGEEPSRPTRRNRRRHKPAPVNPGARGARSVTVGLGQGDASRQGAGGALAADASASATRNRSHSPASSTGGEFGPRPQVSISLDDEDDVLASVPRAAVGGAATQTAVDEPVCSTPVQPAPSAAVTAENWSQSQGPEVMPPKVPVRPLLTTMDVIGMARPFWFNPIDDGASRVASAMLENFSTALSHENLAINARWAHAGRRDHAQYLLHCLTEQGRMRVPLEDVVNQLWWFLSNMQH